MDLSVPGQDLSVYQQVCERFLNLKLLAQNACTSPERLDLCKQLVRDDISTRRLSRVQNMGDLLLLLEKRNLLSPTIPEPIGRWKQALDSQELSDALTEYLQIIDLQRATIRRFFLEALRRRDRRTLVEKEVEKIKLHNSNGSTTPETVGFLQQRDDIYALLQKEIGKQWNALGRSLKLSQTELHEIEMKYQNDLKARIWAVLEHAEHEFREEFVENLKDALSKCRRNDLKRKLEKMLT
ncbi:fas-associated death domain protein [Anopheles bellator]|uniref:fas-associated death domain protein n=1 Tax=Anopheles bellator TaxID=139047 RepID=UPI002649C261|nr:fas-associated death domain protein [Anopheles bellator]